MNHISIIISTSTLPRNRAIQFNSFAPVIPDGFGVAYRADPENLGCVAAAYPTGDALGFLQRVERRLDFIYDTLQ
jgi:carnitine O-palmitoyltransferase 2